MTTQPPLRLPAELTRRARALVTGDDGWVPPAPRDAATIALLRDGVAGLEVFVLRRVRTMAFAAGMHVFPGGALEEQDIDPSVPWRPAPVWDAAAAALAVSADAGIARGLVVAAVRETFEECGVLVAVDAAGRPPVRDRHDPHDVVGWEADRVDVLEGRRSFGDVLSARGLAVDPTVVPVWGHWVTPAVEDRRFDTRFYVAAMPHGQDAHDVGGEADRVRWVRPADALAAYGRGEMADAAADGRHAARAGQPCRPERCGGRSGVPPPEAADAGAGPWRRRRGRLAPGRCPHR